MEFDIVVFGATGFTGQQAARYLAATPGLKLAIAGRSASKLDAVKATLPRQDIGVIVADAADQKSIDAMCARTRVMCTTAGPFTLYGSHVVESCVRHKTDYVDITGETTWVADMIARHGAQAKDNGTRLIPFSGYDSVPSDLGTYLVCQALRAKGEATVRVDGFHSAKGGLNGGTWLTLLTIAQQGRAKEMFNPFLLSPGFQASPEVIKASVDVFKPTWHEGAKRYAAPFFMGMINTRVVRRSQMLFAQSDHAYGPNFVYQEYMGLKQKSLAYGMSAAFALVNKMSGNALTRKLMATLGPSPGEGPSEATMDNGYCRSLFYAVGSKGTRLVGEISGPGDPGNRATVRFLCESALALIQDRDRLPKDAGFLTPATAFGDVLVARLKARGVRLEVRAAI